MTDDEAFPCDQLLLAVQRGDLGSVKTLLQEDSNESFSNHFKASNNNEKRNLVGKFFTKNGFLMIHVAAQYGHTHLVKLLLKYSDVDVESKNLETPLMIAALNNNEQTIELLITSGANVNHKSDRSQGERSVLFFACLGGERKIVEFLVDRGAKLYTKPNGALGQNEIVETLLQKNVYTRTIPGKSIVGCD